MIDRFVDAAINIANIPCKRRTSIAKRQIPGRPTHNYNAIELFRKEENEEICVRFIQTYDNACVFEQEFVYYDDVMCVPNVDEELGPTSIVMDIKGAEYAAEYIAETFEKPYLVAFESNSPAGKFYALECLNRCYDTKTFTSLLTEFIVLDHRYFEYSELNTMSHDVLHKAEQLGIREETRLMWIRLEKNMKIAKEISD